MTIAWEDAYKIGNAEIDAQHEEIFSHVNMFLAATDSPTLSLGAMTLFTYVREHFAHEERLMKKVRYPEIAAHVSEHNDLFTRLNSVAGSISRADLETFISDWIVNHIATSDAKLAKFVESRN